MSPVYRQSRFPKPVAVTLVNDEGRDIFEGETDGINDNGMGCNVRSLDRKTNIGAGEIYTVRFEVPIPHLKMPRGKVIRLKPPLGEDAQLYWARFVAIEFIDKIDSARFYDAIAEARRKA